MKTAEAEIPLIKLKCGCLYSSGLRELMNLFPDDECYIMDTLDPQTGAGACRLPGLTPTSNLFVLYMVARQYNFPDKNILEIGTNRGRSSYAMAIAAPFATLTSLEIDRDNWLFAKHLHETGEFGPTYKVLPVETTLILTDSARYLATYKGPGLDMIFVDGDHEDGVLIDGAWWNHINPYGCFLWHDYHGLFPKVIEAVERMETLVGREPDVQLLTDACMVGFYKMPGDPEWKRDE